MSFIERIQNGWNLTKTSLKVVKEDKEILAFPVISAVVCVIITLAFALPIIFGGILSEASKAGEILLYSILFGYLILIYLTSTFFKAAIISSATIRFNGKDPSLSDGLKQPSKKMFKLFIWSIVLVVVNIIISILRGKREENNNAIGFAREAGADLAETAWNLLTYFVIPIILFEELGIWASIKESTVLFKKTWGENITAQFTVNGILFLISLAFFIPAVLLMISGILPLVIIGVILFLTTISAYSIISVSVNGILIATLYHYAKKGKAPKVFDNDLVKGMFKKK